MRPIIKKVNLNELPLPSVKKICKCKTLCNEGLTLTSYNDGTILCWNDARKFLYDLIKNLDAERITTWSPKDEEYMIEKFNKEGMYRGFNREVAEALGKTYQQVKSKTRRLREKGAFKNPME